MKLQFPPHPVHGSIGSLGAQAVADSVCAPRICSEKRGERAYKRRARECNAIFHAPAGRDVVKSCEWPCMCCLYTHTHVYSPPGGEGGGGVLPVPYTPRANGSYTGGGTRHVCPTCVEYI